MYKRITALLLAFCLVFSAVPVFAGAADGAAVSAGTATVYPGNTAAITLKAENFVNIAALDVYVYYDAEMFTVSSTGGGSMLSGAQASVNTAEAGSVKLSAMALNGINGTGNLLTVYFSVAAGATPGTYPVTVAVGRAYDGNLAVASIGSANGSITVNEPVETEYFNIYGDPNKYTLQKDDTLVYQVNASYQAFVSGDFTLEYDHEVFAFDSLELDPALTKEGAVYSVNSATLGQVRLTYASTEPVSNYRLFTVRLTVIADVNSTTTLKLQASNMYREDLSMYLPGSSSNGLTLQKLPEVIDYPNASLQTQKLIAGQQSLSVFSLEAGAGIAAADFTIRYDPTVFKCVSVTAAEEVAAHGGMVVINDNFSDGSIRFSYINMQAYGDTDLPLVQITWEPLRSPESHYQITSSGVGVVDAQQNLVTLEYVTDTGCIFAPTVIPPTCLVDGRTNYACACGENYDMDPVEKLGHDIHQYGAQTQTCTAIGWDAYEACSRCDYTTCVEIPALGHDYINHEGKPVSCTDMGWDGYQTCSRCDYTSYAEKPALGHRVTLNHTEWVEPVFVTNEGESAFTLTDGTYYSNNHTDGSVSEFTVTALYGCTLELVYGVSSEYNWDKLFITHNETQVVMASGEADNQQITLSLNAGDVVTIRYQKDGSASAGQDMGWVKLVYDLYGIPSFEDVPAQTQNPDCTNAVVCSYCDTVIKEALGHDYIDHEGKQVTCTEIGWDAYATCSRCDYTSYVEIPALGHDYIHHDAQPVTCLQIGWEAYDTCSRCDYSSYVEIPALGHGYIYHDAKAPACTEIGWDAYETCSRCDYTTYVEIPALEHDYIDHDAKAPTCIDIGWDAYETCSRCDYSSYVEIPANGHSFAHTVCSVCGDKQSPLETWDISAAQDGSLMAYLYENHTEGGHEMEIVGSGEMANYSYNAPWYYRYCSTLNRVTLPEGLTSIGNCAFYSCEALRQIRIPNSVERIGEYAFAYDDKLVAVFDRDSLPSELGSGWNWGVGCYFRPQKVIFQTDTTYVIDRDGTAVLAKYVGNDSEFVALESVEGIPVTKIGDSAFYGRSNLSTYWIPPQIQAIGNEAFSKCNGLVLLLESSQLPASLGNSWNGNCPYYLMAKLYRESGFLFVLDQEEQLHLVGYEGSDKELTVPANVSGYPVVYVDSYALSGLNIEKVIFPEGLRTIGGYTFSGCSALREVLLPESLLSIEQYAFENCSSLTQILLPENLTRIGMYVFWGCGALTSIVIPDGITVLDGTFVNCYNLETVILPDGITQLGGMTFYGCQSLKELRLPESLQSFGYATFYSCNALRTLEIPENVHNVTWNTSFQSTDLDVLYIRSYQLAANLNSAIANFDLFQNLETVVVPAGTGTDHLASAYPYCQTAQRNGVDVDIYSLCAHEWQTQTVTEMIPCQTDGYLIHSCSLCGVETETRIPRHTLAQTQVPPTCAEEGYTLHSCPDCEESYRTDPVEKLDHDYSEDPLVCDECGYARATLKITTVTLRPGVAGLYFSGQLTWDETDEQILSCGITVSLSNPLPVADGSDESCLYTQGSISALVENILSSENTTAENKANARMPVYARAYVQLSDGRYIYSDAVQVCLQQVVMGADNKWDSLSDTQKDALKDMYESFSDVMSKWKIPNIKTAN